MESNIGIKQELIGKVVKGLSALLADEFVLYTKTRNAHWNVVGSDFHAAHKFFEVQYEFLDQVLDDVAERIRSLGHNAPATLGEYLRITMLKEQSPHSNSSAEFMKELLLDHENIILTLRKQISLFTDEYKDAGTGDFITGLMEQHEKLSWMLRAHL